MQEHARAGELIFAAIMKLFPERTECAPAQNTSQGVLSPPRMTHYCSLVGHTPGECAGWRKIVHFNDHEDTTPGDVMLVLKHAEGEYDALGNRDEE